MTTLVAPCSAEVGFGPLAGWTTSSSSVRTVRIARFAVARIAYTRYWTESWMSAVVCSGKSAKQLGRRAVVSER